MRFTLLVHTKAGNAALGAVHGILEVRRLALGVVRGPLEAGHGILGVEKEPLGVRHATRGAENPRLDPARERPGVVHGEPEPGNAAHEVENGKLEVEYEPPEFANQRLEAQKRVDSVRRPRRVGGGALDQGDGAGPGQYSGLGRAGRRAKPAGYGSLTTDGSTFQSRGRAVPEVRPLLPTP